MRLIVKQGSLQLPRSGRHRAPMLRKGDIVPPGALPREEIDRLIKAGILGVDADAVPAPAAGLPPTRGKWQHDPAALAGKSLDQLRAMVLDADASVDVDDLSEASLVQLLTSDYNPVFAAPQRKANDRHRPTPDALKVARRGAERDGA